ncbi:MAG: hypothetical protein KUG53_00085 [Pseudomonadales bacterium]|nr:hypothetical protein [Pseudomonadales bacterium]
MKKSKLTSRFAKVSLMLGATLVASQASAAVNVRVQPSGNTVPTAYTLAGEQRTFFGNVEGAAGYECSWSYSDGTPATAYAAVGDSRYITTDHTFATAGNHFLALDCRDSSNPSDSDSATIEVTALSADSQNRKVNSAVDNGLRYSYQQVITSGTNQGCLAGNSYGLYVPTTGMALLAFENHGHNLESSAEDIYRPVVEAGLQCMFDRYAQNVTIGSQTCIGDPETGDGDLEADSRGVRFQSGDQYYTPFALMALVNASGKTYAQANTISSTNSAVDGLTLYELAAEVRDYLSWSMTDINSCTRNGWRYGENYSSIDNSISQWPALALAETEDRWGIVVKDEVKTQYAGWLAYSQESRAGTNFGSFGYSGYTGYNNMSKTAAGLIGFHWLGKPLTDQEAVDALGYMATRYNQNYYSTWYGHWNNYYAMYAFYKAMKLHGKTTFTDSAGVVHDWESEYHNFLIDAAAGHYVYDAGTKAYRFEDQFPYYSSGFSTYTALAMLAPDVAGLPPVANAGVDQNVLPGQLVSFDGTGSFHQDPAKNIARYEWDYDLSDGLWWSTASVPAAGEGAIGSTAQYAYTDTGSAEDYTVTLRVLDDGLTPSNPAPVETDTDTLNVHSESAQVPPVAVTNGPWAGVPGTAVVFDGSASYDPNPADTIVSYEWDLDGDGVYNEANGNDGTPATPGDWSIVTKTYATPESGLATLRVTDNHGAAGSATNEFISIALAYATDYQTCWYQRLGRTVTRYGLSVTFENTGTVAAENLEVTLTSVPTNRTIISDASVLGTLNAGAQAVTSCDTAAKTADIVTDVNARVIPTGDWTWKAEFDADGVHYIIPNLPALGQ